MFSNLKKCKQIIAIALIAAFFFVITYFTVFESTHVIHECSGEDCPICHELHVAEGFTKQLTTVAFAAAVCFFYTVFIKFVGTVNSCSFSERNLIQDKVRLDD